MASSVNELLRDAEVDHQVNLEQYKAGLVRRMIGLLNRTDADLAAQLAAALDRVEGRPFSVEWLDAQLHAVRALNAQAYQRVGYALTQELEGFAAEEAGFQLRLFEDAIPAQVAIRLAGVAPETVIAAAYAQPFRGRLLREWASSIEADRMVRIRDAVRLGVVEGQTIDQIVRRVRGTRARGYGDGIIEIDRRHAQAVVRTAVSHVAAVARDRFMAANTDIVKATAWSSTLDTRTSEICRVRDGKHYHPVTHRPIGHKLEWLGGPGRAHWNCRSSSVPVTKSWRELGADIEFTPSTRASMDGQVPADLSYAEWFKRQSAARQDEIVGPARGKLMREGRLPFDALYTERGQWLTLDELKARNAAAFKRAGVEA